MEAVASVVTLANLSFDLITIIRDIKSRNEQKRRLLTEINSLWLVLEDIKSQWDDKDDRFAHDLQSNIVALDNHGGVLAEIRQLIDELTGRLGGKNDRFDKFKQRLSWLWDKQEFENLTLRISRLRDVVSLALTSTNTAILRSIENRTADIQLSHDNENLKAALEWLSPYNFLKQQQRLTAAVHEGSGTWLLQHESFELWRDSNDALLWCPGILGAGKTYLSAIVSNHLRKHYHDQNVVVLNLFVGYTDRESRSLTFLIAALLKQVIQRQPDLARDVLENHSIHFLKKTFPKLEDLTHLLRKALCIFQRSFIVIDALDEVEEPDRLRLLELLSCNDVAIMVTSRPIPTVSELFATTESCDMCENKCSKILTCCERCSSSTNRCVTCHKGSSVCLEESHFTLKKFAASRVDVRACQDDIENYIQWRIDHEPKILKWVNLKKISREEIVTTVASRADGMFLVARFYMDDLATKRQLYCIRKILQSPRAAIDDTYQRCMQRIQESNLEDRQFAMNLLLWMAFSTRPLKVDELEHAVSVQPDMEDLDVADILQASDLVSLCAGLVIVDARGLILFVHLSAEQYLKENGMRWFDNGHLAIARTCLTYMSFKSFGTNHSCDSPVEYKHMSEQLLADYPFLLYACRSFGMHMRLAEFADDLVAGALNLLESKPHADTIGQILLYSDHNLRLSPATVTQSKIAKYYGLTDVIKTLTDNVDLGDQDKVSWETLINNTPEEQKARFRTFHPDQLLSIADALGEHVDGVSVLN